MTNGLRTFTDSVSIVTGGGSGIGNALAEALAQRGGHVVVSDVDAGDAEEVARQISARGGRATASRLDVCSFDDFRALVDATAARHGRLDYVFNNAGIGVVGEVAEYTIESWERILGVNLCGVINGVQAAYPVMIRQRFGHIVNTASMAGLTTGPGMASYSTTKHAVVALSRALRAEADGYGVRVSVLCPGVIRTPLIQGGKHGIFLGRLPEARQRALAQTFFERLRPMPAATLASKALDRIARNQAVIILPAWWRVLWWMERASPSLMLFMARKGVEQARRRLEAER
jgi:NAD(P)-dependent dehydrogenase (short-subunit alcohol dehydrogenase family)